MKLTPVVAQLRDRVPFFARRVFGGIDWEALEDSAKLATPCAYVIVGDSDAERNKYQSLVAQDVTDQFDVVVVLDAPNGQDLERIDDVHMVRSLLSLALVGWKPMPDFDPIEFVGGQLILQNRARIVYRFSYLTEFQLGRGDAAGPAENWGDVVRDELPMIDGIKFELDAIDPIADKNLKYPGPDGRIEITINQEFTSE